MNIKGLDRVKEEDVERFLCEILLLEKQIVDMYHNESMFDPTDRAIGLGYQKALIEKVIRTAETKLHVRLAKL